MITTLLDRFDRMPADLKQAVAEQAWTTATTEQRATIASARGLSESFHAVMAEDKTPEVRIALLTNPCTPADLVREVLAGESRAQVIASCLNQCRHDVNRRRLLEEAAEARMTAKPSVSLAAALIGVSALETGLLSAVLTCLVASSRMLPAQRHDALVRQLGEVNDEDAARLLTLTYRLDYLVALLGSAPSITRNLFTDVAERLVVYIEADESYTHNTAYMRATRANRAADLLLGTLRSSEGDEAWVRVLEDKAACARSSEMRAAVGAAAEGARAILEVTDPDAPPSLDALIKKADAGDRDALIEVARHPEVAPEVRQAALSKLAGRMTSLALQIAREHDEVYALLRSSGLHLFECKLLAGALGESDDERRATAIRLIQDLAGETGRQHIWTYDSALVGYGGRGGLHALPWARMLAIITTHDGWECAAGTLFAQECLTRLTSPEHWSAYESLSAGWTGSTGELFDAVDALCTDSTQQAS